MEKVKKREESEKNEETKFCTLIKQESEVAV